VHFSSTSLTIIQFRFSAAFSRRSPNSLLFSKFRAEPRNDFEGDFGARLLQHFDGGGVFHVFQAVAVDGQQTVAASESKKQNAFSQNCVPRIATTINNAEAHHSRAL